MQTEVSLYFVENKEIFLEAIIIMLVIVDWIFLKHVVDKLLAKDKWPLLIMLAAFYAGSVFTVTNVVMRALSLFPNNVAIPATFSPSIFSFLDWIVIAATLPMTLVVMKWTMPEKRRVRKKSSFWTK